MEIEHRSIQLTSNGVNKVRGRLDGDIKAKGKVSNIISGGTLDNMLKRKPAYTNNVRRVFSGLDLQLEEADWEPVTPRPPDGGAANASAGGMTSNLSFPLSECMERVAHAAEVCFLSTWLVNKESMAQLLVGRANERTGRTRLLVLDPQSAHVAHRGNDLNASRLAELEESDAVKAAEKEAKADVRADIMNSLRVISHLASYGQSEQSEKHLEVGVYDSTPTMTLLIADGYVCQGFHWRDHQGSSMPHIEYTREQMRPWYQAASDHFNAIWNSRTTYLYDPGAKKIVRNASLSQVLRTIKEPF